MKKEAHIYNDIINQLTKKFKNKNKYIWFKCITLSVLTTNFLKNINCNFFSYSDFEIAELKMKNKNLKYVVSTSSSSPQSMVKRYLKKMYFFRFKKSKYRKSSSERNYLNFIKFNLEIIKEKKNIKLKKIAIIPAKSFSRRLSNKNFEKLKIKHLLN